MAILNYLGAKGRLSSWILSQPEVLTLFAQHDFVESLELFAGTAEVSRLACTKFGPSLTRAVTVDSLLAPTLLLGAHALEGGHDWRDFSSEALRVALTELEKDDEHWAKMAGMIRPGSFVYEYAVARSYFTVANAARIQWLNDQLESPFVNATTRRYLRGLLVAAADKVANVASVYGACLKRVKKSALKPLRLELPNVAPYSLGALEVREGEVDRQSVVGYGEVFHSAGGLFAYADPPYNGRDYKTYYHVLETIARWDIREFTPEGKTGQRPKAWRAPSPYGSKRLAPKAFNELFAGVAQLLGERGPFLLSYSNEAILPQEQMLELLKRHFEHVRVASTEVSRFRSQAGSAVETQVTELLFVASNGAKP